MAYLGRCEPSSDVSALSHLKIITSKILVNLGISPPSEAGCNAAVPSIKSEVRAPQRSNHSKSRTFDDSGADFLASDRLLICKLLSAAALEPAGGRCRGRLVRCSAACSTPWVPAARECAPPLATLLSTATSLHTGSAIGIVYDSVDRVSSKRGSEYRYGSRFTCVIHAFASR